MYEQKERKIYIDLPMGEIPELKESFCDDTATPSLQQRRQSSST